MAKEAPSSEVLIIEDNIDARSALAEILELHGYRVACTSNGREGLEFLEHSVPPHLILLDLRMPVMDGWQFRSAQRNHERIKDIPVLVLSAMPDDKIEADGFFPKPVDLEKLLNTIRRFCNPSMPVAQGVALFWNVFGIIENYAEPEERTELARLFLPDPDEPTAASRTADVSGPALPATSKAALVRAQGAGFRRIY